MERLIAISPWTREQTDFVSLNQPHRLFRLRCHASGGDGGGTQRLKDSQKDHRGRLSGHHAHEAAIGRWLGLLLPRLVVTREAGRDMGDGLRAHVPSHGMRPARQSASAGAGEYNTGVRSIQFHRGAQCGGIGERLQFSSDYVQTSNIDSQPSHAQQERHRDGGGDEDETAFGLGGSGSTDCHNLIIGRYADFR